ncbi:MAG: hypothetical protein FJY92_04480, partial [Candidatus Hydrogenedentes bacterium]|nr:hypothetical protein [Candidatus Hydrogenedentota bacterium]
MNSRRFISLSMSALVALCSAASGALPSTIEDTPFVQEYHEAFPLASENENDVRGVAVDAQGRVWAAT